MYGAGPLPLPATHQDTVWAAGRGSGPAPYLIQLGWISNQGATLRPAKRLIAHHATEAIMADLKKGDEVTWKSHGGTAHGTVEKKQTSDTTIKGHTVRASKDDPQFIVKSDNGGKAAHKADALKKA
jgi:hypothetical protein